MLIRWMVALAGRLGDAPERRMAVPVAVANLLLLCLIGSAQAATLPLAALDEGQFIADLAGLLDADTSERLQEINRALVTDRAPPIIVSTIASKAIYGGRRLSFAGFASRLFHQWGIGSTTLVDHGGNVGVLLLVSKGDSEVQLELGSGWGSREVDRAHQILTDQVIAQFRQGHYAGGIEAGVRALDKLVRTSLDVSDLSDARARAGGQVAADVDSTARIERKKYNRNPFSWTRQEWLDNRYAVAFLVILVLSVISFAMSGKRGLAWTVWSLFFRLLGILLQGLSSVMTRSVGHGYYGGGYSMGRW